MTTFFLVTFLVGAGLTLVSFILGAVDAGLGHVGDAGGGHIDMGGHAGHVDMGGHAGHVDVGHGHGGHIHADAAQSAVATVSPINYQSLVGFMIGFGGVGYLLCRTGKFGLILAIPLAAGAGLCSGWLVLKWLRFLVRSQRPLPPTSYIGLSGKLTLGIREGGTGELVYSRHGTRSVVAARSADGRAIPKGQDVVVMRYERGIAYVQPVHEVLRQTFGPDGEEQPRSKPSERPRTQG